MSFDSAMLPLRGQRILVADDEVIIALDMAATLEDQGAEIVGPFSTLEQTLASAHHDSISVAVLDIRLGRALIGPVAELLRERRIPFVFQSGQELPPAIRQMCPDTVVLTKPVAPERLVEAVVSCL